MKSVLRRHISLASVLAAAGHALAQQPLTHSYGPLSHGASITTAGNIAPEVRLGYTLYTYAKTNRCIAAPSGSSGQLLSGPLGVGAFAPPARTTNMVNSWATSSAAANVIALAPGSTSFTYSVSGSATADITGCPPPALPRGRGYAHAWSAAAIAVRGRNMDSRGRITYRGDWHVTQTISGSAAASRGVHDPIVGIQHDLTTGIDTRYELGWFKAIVGDGDTAWENDMLTSTAHRLLLDIQIGNPTATVEHGSVHLRVDDGVVTESAATGMFAGLALPAVGALGTSVSAPLPAIDINYDLGGDQTHVLEPELDFDNGTETDAVAAGLDTSGALVTDIGVGFGHANVSELLPGGSVLGVDTGIGHQHVAEDFVVPPGCPWNLEAIEWPVFQTGSPAGAPLGAAFVRIWRGLPGSPSGLIAGDLTTNRLLETDFDGLYRVQGDVGSNARAVKDAVIDLSWVPPLPPGPYWIEIAVAGGPGSTAEPQTPPNIWREEDANAMAFDEAAEQWRPLVDPVAQRPLSLPFRLYGFSCPSRCYANCDGSTAVPFLNVNDFVCFQSRFASGDPYANCDGSTQPPVLNVNDFICFQNRFAAGCSAP